MSSNKKTIILTTILSLIFVLLTYLVTLSNAYNWIQIKWLNNDFLLAVFGGAFASMLVVLICEIQKYFINKKDAENKMYFYVTEMLARCIASKNTLLKIRDTANSIVPNNLLTELQNRIHNLISIYCSIDYNTFLSKNPIAKQRSSFNTFILQDVQTLTFECAFLDIAINTESVKTNGSVVKNDNTIIQQLLCIYINKLNNCIEKISSFLRAIDYKGTYLFDNAYQSVQRDNEKIAQDKTLDDFLRENQSISK